MRTHWPPDFPLVLVHAPWSLKDQQGEYGLVDHPLYTPAKTQGDAFAAIGLIDDLARDEIVEKISDLAYYRTIGPDLFTIAPASDDRGVGNALAISYAEWLAADLGCVAAKTVFHRKKTSRDRRGSWFRIAHSPDFYGEIQPGANYIIVDDVFTMGGTLAALKGFIEANGGRVVGMSALACPSSNRQIALDDATVAELKYRFGEEIDDFCQKTLGYPVVCLTFPEARVLVRCENLDEARAHIDRERGGAHP